MFSAQHTMLFSAGLTLALQTCSLAADFRGLGHFEGVEHFSSASAISNDGLTVVGTASSENYTEPFVWTPTAGMQRLDNILTVITPGAANDISADGSVIVGLADFGNVSAFRWQDAGFQLFGENSPTVAEGVSADGAVVVGTENFSRGGGPAPVTGNAFRWTAGTGLTKLDDLPGGPDCSRALDVSANGATIVGVGDCDASFQVEDVGTAVRWVNGMPESLGYLPGGTVSRASAVSPDGIAIVGGSGSSAGQQPFLWTEKDGMIGLGNFEENSYGWAEAVSAEGRIVAGSSGGKAFIWTDYLGMIDVKAYLERGGYLDLEGWQLTSATAITPDGLNIAGVGINPEGETEAWFANLLDPGEDGDIDLDDLNNVRNNFGGAGLGDMWPPDGIVDLYDLNFVRNWFNSTIPPSASVPEPGTWVLALVGLAVVAGFTARRHPLR